MHIQQRNEALPDEMIQLMKSQDKNYIKMQRDISRKKMERLRDSLHFLDEAGVDDLEIYDGEEEEEKEDEEEELPKKNNHIVFVDTEEEGSSTGKHVCRVPC